MPSNAKLARKAAMAAANNKCILCGKDNGEYGHNADPVAKGRCCEKCNITRVIPERMRITKASGVRAEYAPVSLLNLIKLRQKKNKDTYFHFSRPKGDGMWEKNDMMTRIMGIWKEQKRQGILVALKENNKDFVIDGRTYYTLSLTQIRPDKSTAEIGLDPYGVEMGFNIHGVIYWFVSEANRDAVVDYIMN